ncbi:MAG: DNA-directed RNA polymerase subunit beta, partial [Oscillospiraceae bacterium]|nr:DNA-directed RNA polymerase subunit beta [Oscillospiraceae bacterium]
MLKVKDVHYGRTLRKSFAKQDEIMEMPHLLDIQQKSYKWFLETGLHEVFKDVSAISDYAQNLELSFIDFQMDETKTKYSLHECIARDATFAAPIRVSVRLRNKENNELKEQEIFMGDFPLMTPQATFVINGAERVVVSQIIRSPGMYYEKRTDKTNLSTYGTTIIPYRGAWLEFETDASDLFHARIDKNRKLPVTWLLRAFGGEIKKDERPWAILSIAAETGGATTTEQLKQIFGEDERIVATLERDTCRDREDALQEIYHRLRPGDPATIESAELLINNFFFEARRYDLSNVGRYKFNKKLALSRRIRGFELAENVLDPISGDIIAMAGERVTELMGDDIEARGVLCVYVHDAAGSIVKVFSNGMVKIGRFVPFSSDELEAMGFNEKVRFVVLRKFLDEINNGDYDSDTERLDALKLKLTDRIDDLIPKHVIPDDVFGAVNYLNCLAHGVGDVDDIDHLGNRRMRSVGELLQNQFRVGFARMERVIRERMTLQDLAMVTPQTLINIRPVTASIKEFFGSSPLSQFMDQANPLAALTHKRRMSALGPGGLSRDRVNYDVRDVHYTHYGRLCPVETPEGPNIGLISYLASYAKVNDYGFIIAPYIKVEKTENGMFVTQTINFMTADIEDQYIVAQ